MDELIAALKRLHELPDGTQVHIVTGFKKDGQYSWVCAINPKDDSYIWLNRECDTLAGAINASCDSQSQV